MEDTQIVCYEAIKIHCCDRHIFLKNLIDKKCIQFDKKNFIPNKFFVKKAYFDNKNHIEIIVSKDNYLYNPQKHNISSRFGRKEKDQNGCCNIE